MAAVLAAIATACALTMAEDTCRQHLCSADCGVADIYAGGGINPEVPDCGWDAENNVCRKGGFTTMSEVLALLESIPGACKHHVKVQDQVSQTTAADFTGGNAGKSMQATLKSRNNQQKVKQPVSKPTKSTKATDHKGRNQVHEAKHQEPPTFHPKTAQPKQEDTTASRLTGETQSNHMKTLDKVAKQQSLEHWLTRYNEQALRETSIGETSQEAGPSAFELFHLCLMKVPRTKPWKGAKKNSMPKSVVSNFEKKYKSTPFVATLFPDHTDGTAQAVNVMPEKCVKSAASFSTVAILNTLVRKSKMKRTVEIGFACGFSASGIAMGHLESGVDGNHHVIDPAYENPDGLQKVGWDGYGLDVTKKLNLSHRITLHASPSHEALPELLKDHGKESFQMVFIDGMHLFDFVIMEVYYADLLLSVGGFLVFDDVWSLGVQQAVLFVIRNKNYEIVLSPHIDPRIVVLQKTSIDDRDWYYHNSF